MSKIQVNEIVNHFDNGAPDCPRGLTVTGVSTFSGNVSIGGTLTYEDVTNIDSVGIITARKTLRVLSASPSIPPSGTGLEIYYASSVFNDTPSAYMISYDRSSSAYKPFTVDASEYRFKGSGTDRLRIDSSGRVGIGTDNPGTPLTVKALDNADSISIHGRNADGITNFTFYGSDGATQYGRIQARPTYLHLAASDSTNGAFIDSSGRLLVGTSSAGTGALASSLFAVQGVAGFPNVAGFMNLQRGEAATSITINEELGVIGFTDNAANVFAKISGVADGTAGSGDYPGRLVFSTTADGASSPTERMRIGSTGAVYIGKTSGSNTVAGVNFVPGNAEYSSFVNNTSDTGARVILINRQGGGVGGRFIEFRYANGICGSITAASSTSVSYNESSDYRLKENVVNITDGIARIKQLQPRRFNFIVDADTTVDGFIAHEAQAVVPQAVTGIKDEVDNDGNPVIQGIDKSKLVPLLTAALQEAIAKIETLETKVQALEGS